jgi:hypothetical protein
MGTANMAISTKVLNIIIRTYYLDELVTTFVSISDIPPVMVG